MNIYTSFAVTCFLRFASAVAVIWIGANVLTSSQSRDGLGWTLVVIGAIGFLDGPSLSKGRAES